MNVLLELDAEQQSAVEAPHDTLVLLTGSAGSGKTTALIRRAAARMAHDPAIAPARFIVTTPLPRPSSLRALLRTAVEPRLRDEVDTVPWLGGDLASVAYMILTEHALAAALPPNPTLIDDEEAEIAFERAGASLFALEWTEFVSAEIDPELAGMRAPERFAAAALRLFRKLRAALIGPDEFLERALRGAGRFYATPPHLAELVKTGSLTATDAIAEAARLLAERPEIARRYRAEFVAAFVDDAQDLTLGSLRFLQALFGKELARVTLAGDRNQATQTLAGARPERVFGLAARSIELHGSYRMSPPVAAAARSALAGPQPGPSSGAVRLFRGRTLAEEAAFIADEIAHLVGAGTAPGEIALVLRSFVWMRPYRDALVDAGLPITMSGSIDLYDEPDVEDALSLLWSACDPFRHDWLLRALATPTVRLNDFGLYLLCGEPSNPQTALFELPDEADSVRSRWDRRRNLRLALNVVRGDRDADLDERTRAAVVAFRERRRRWERSLVELQPQDAAAAIIAEGGLRAELPGETAARTALRHDLLDALLRRIEAYTKRKRASLHDFLTYAERTSLA